MHTGDMTPSGGEAGCKGRMDREDRREAILDVATDVFLKEGYASASMSTIAARVGGSKGTLYNYFKSKEELFEAYVQRSCVFHRGEIAHLLTEEGDARTVLTRFARGYVRAFTAEPALQNWRVISAESHKSPEVGRMFYEAGPLTGARIIAAYIEKARDRGELRRFAHEHGELHQAGKATTGAPAVAGQTERGLQHHLGLQRRAQLHHGVQLLGPLVPEGAAHAGGDLDGIPRAHGIMSTVDAEARLAGDHLDRLDLHRAGMLGARSPFRTDRALVAEKLTIGLGGCLQEEHPLPASGVIDDVACSCHEWGPSVVCSSPCSPRRRGQQSSPPDVDYGSKRTVVLV